MDRTSDEVAELVEALPEYFKGLQPLFAPKVSRAIQDLDFRWRTLGRAAVLGGEITLPSRRVTVWGREITVPSVRLPAFGPRRYDATKLAAAAKAAKRDRRTDQMLRELAVNMIGRGEPLPPEIRPLARALIKGTHKPPPAKRGKKPEDNFVRDGFIALAVEALVQCGVQPTRNREQKNIDSACSIVTRALKEAGIHMMEPAVEKIWRSRPHEAPPRPKRTPQPRKRA
jgi:hypothetical protein